MLFANGDTLNPLLPAVPDLVWGTISFIIVAVVVYKIAWPAFSKTLDERTEKIDKGLNAAAAAQEEIAQERAKLEEDTTEALKKAAAIREQAEANAASIVSAAQKAAQQDAQRIVEQANMQIASDTEKARRTLQSDIGAVASELAARIVGAQVLDPKVSEKVIDAFLNELEANTAVKASKEA
ncbi:MAG: F0F1 ATP synthase subunit B [Actinomycetaceae bacterium]|nr:F0F1 ATP synthase subunit B [Actinomycetaceae bacterium]